MWRYRPPGVQEDPLRLSLALMQLGALVNALGSGMTMPFLLIYLHNVRGIPLPLAGLVLAVDAAAAAAASFAAGPAVDRFGGKAVLTASMAVSTLGFVSYVFVREPWQAASAAILTGAGAGAFWTGHSSLLAALTDRSVRSRAYATQRVLHNAGIGMGAFLGGVLASTTNPSTYSVLLFGNATSFLIYLALLAGVRVVAPVHGENRRAVGGYRDVIRDRRFLTLLALNVSLISVGFALLQDILPAYAKNNLDVSEDGIGALFLINTVVVVVAQLPIARLLRGRRRMWAYGLQGALWAVTWLIVLAAVTVKDDRAATMVVLACAVALFAIGECFHGSILYPLIVDLSRPGLLGRYVALQSMSHQLGWSIGRGLAGLALAVAPTGLWGAAAVLAVLAGLGALVFERALPEQVRRNPGA